MENTASLFLETFSTPKRNEITCKLIKQSQNSIIAQCILVRINNFAAKETLQHGGSRWPRLFSPSVSHCTECNGPLTSLT